MTGRERILAAFRGEAPDTVPFCPNIYNWFYNHQARGTLPAELAGCGHPVDALRRLGADMLIRWDTQRATQEMYRPPGCTEETGGPPLFARPVVTAFHVYPPGSSRKTLRFRTPYGDLTSTWTLSREAGADFVSEYFWKQWSDYPAVRFLFESLAYSFDLAVLEHWARRVGGDGVVMVPFTHSPLKAFHWLAGPEQASLFLIDHPDEMRELAAMHQARALEMLRRIADHPLADVFISVDNLDSAFYSPRFYRDYCDEFFSRAAEIIHARGKILVVHACGRNRALLPLVQRSGVDCLEGLAPPPLGNVELSEARRLAGSDRFVVNGGMDPGHLEILDDAERRLDEYTRDLFAAMGDRRRFLYASSCTTSVVTPWRNLVYARDAARRYGRLC